jgi:hypothetical protein
LLSQGARDDANRLVGNDHLAGWRTAWTHRCKLLPRAESTAIATGISNMAFRSVELNGAVPGQFR